MPKETPLQTVKRLYGSKDKLIDSVVDAAKGAGDDVSDLKERLMTASNRKLLRLAAVSQTIKERYGGRDKLIGKLSETVGKAKDSDYVEKLRGLSSARLLDLMGAAERRAKKASARG